MKKKHALPITFFIVMILYNFATGFAHPVTPTLIIERNLPSQWYGYAMSAVSIGSFLIAPFWGKLCNYVSTKKMIIFGNLGYIFGQVIMCTAFSGPQLLIGRVAAGTLSCAATIGNLNYIMNIGDEKNRSRYLTVYATAGSVCNAAGYFVGGFLGVISVEAAFIGQALICAFAAAMAFFVLEDDTPYKPTPERGMHIKDVNPFSAFLDARGYLTPALILFFTAFTLMGIGMSGFENSFNYYIKDIFKLGSQYNGTIKAVIAIGGLFINSTVCMYIIRRTNLDLSVSWMATILASFTVLSLFAFRSMMVLSTFFVMYSISNFLLMSVSQNLIARKSTAETSNSMMGFYQGMRSLGSVIGSFIQANLYAMGAHYSFYFASGMMVLGTALMYLYSAMSAKKA